MRESMTANYLSRDIPVIPMQPAVTAIYRIAQETLRNAAKHAGKTHVKLILKVRPGSLYLEVVDLGMGVDQDSKEAKHLHGLGRESLQKKLPRHSTS